MQHIDNRLRDVWFLLDRNRGSKSLSFDTSKLQKGHYSQRRLYIIRTFIIVVLDVRRPPSGGQYFMTVLFYFFIYRFVLHVRAYRDNHAQQNGGPNTLNIIRTATYSIHRTLSLSGTGARAYNIHYITFRNDFRYFYFRN